MDLLEALERIAQLEWQLKIQKLLADNCFEAIGVFDENLQVIAGNQEAREVLGYDPNTSSGMHILSFLDEKSHPEAKKNIATNVLEPYFAVARRKDGTTFPAEVRGRTHTIDGKKYRVAALRDISFRESTLTDLREALREMELIFVNSKVGIMYLKGGRIIHKVNQTLADILGYATPEEMRGMKIRDIHLSDKDYEEFGVQYFDALAEGAQLHIEYPLRRKDGGVVWCSFSGQAVDTTPPIDLEEGVLWVVDDITQRKATEKQLIKLATTDDLTGALKRKEFFRLTQTVWKRDKRTAAGPSLLMLDLDYFKNVNDTYGHEAGDKVLQTFARECRSVLRDEDLFARLGGEEFAIFLPGSGLGGAMSLGQRLRKRIAASVISTEAGDIRYTVSIGIATSGSRNLNMDELLRRADKSLYYAKKEGRNRVAFYD